MLRANKKGWADPARMKDKMTTQGERIADARRLKGLTQRQLAKLIGVSKGAVSQYEQNVVDDIGSKIMHRLASTLEVSGIWLITGEGSPTRRLEISPEELDLLLTYRELNVAAQELLRSKAHEYHEIAGPQAPTRAHPVKSHKK